MTPAQTALLADLAPMLGPKGIVTDPADIAPWTIDWRQRFRGTAPALLAPASNRRGCGGGLAAAARHRVALVPQGGNSSMVGGATPPGDGSALILSLRRMNRMRSVDAAAGLASRRRG